MNIQMILALGAMMLLSLIIINVNKTSLYTEETMYDSSFGILATSLGTSIIEDASRKYFDHKTETMNITFLNDLTPAGSLGRESGEQADDPETFNDFDDYNNFTKVDSTMPSAIFNVYSVVQYVEDTNPDIPVTAKTTWHKRITVTVTSKFMKDTIRQSSVFSYWNFR